MHHGRLAINNVCVNSEDNSVVAAVQTIVTLLELKYEIIDWLSSRVKPDRESSRNTYFAERIAARSKNSFFFTAIGSDGARGVTTVPSFMGSDSIN